MKCKFVKLNNEQCNANAMKEAEFCFTHNPETREAHRKATKRGGLVGIHRSNLSPVRIKAMKDAVALLEDTVNRVRSGEMEIRVANCIGYLSGHIIRGLEKSDLEQRIEGLEKLILKEEQNKSF